ncbi:MAG: carboxypeptidase regulatory-like domain-containing protein [Planctomycetaceae bacterium]|nr:carboxypeptidase regulatory-like domain-containing protein [Planctomycetaceae bacterium]
MTEFHFLSSFPVGVGWLLVLVAAALGGFLYWREVYDFPAPYRWLLPTLRALAIALVVLMLLEPTLRYRYFEGTPTRLQVWVDGTQSMQETDSLETGNSPQPTRYERALELLTQGDSPLLEQWADQGEVLLGRFGGEQTTSLWQSTIEQRQELPKDRSDWLLSEGAQPTSLSLIFQDQALTAKNNSSKRDQELTTTSPQAVQPLPNTPILLLTDGQHNSGPGPLGLLNQWPQESSPVFVVGMGAAEIPQRVTLTKWELPSRVFRSDLVQGTLQLQEGLTPGARYRVAIYHDTKVLWSTELTAAGDQQRSERFSFQLDEVVAQLEAALPQAQRSTRIHVPLMAKAMSLAPGGTSSHQEPSSELSGVIGVTARKQRVLLLDSRSRWETRYIRNMLERDPSWELDAYLVKPGGSPKWFSNVVEEKPFPMKPEEFERYDLVVCGEIEPSSLSPEQMELLRHSIERGGTGWLVIDGQRGHWRQPMFSELQKILPISWLENSGSASERRWQISPVGQALHANVLSLVNDAQEDNLAIWAKLPRLRRVVPTKPLPGSEVLATVEDSQDSIPLFVTRNYGAARIFYAASDETWRWRHENADLIHQRVWNQICRWTMREPFAVENDYLALDSGEAVYNTGQEIVIRARVKDSQGHPSTLPTIDALALADGKPVATAILELETELPGVYRGRMAGLPPGDYTIKLAIPGYATEVNSLHTSLRVEAPANPERLQVTRHDDLLREIAAATGGRYATEDQVDDLWRDLKLRYSSRIVEADHVLWQSYWWFVPILILVSLEWWLRKKVGLI